MTPIVYTDLQQVISGYFTGDLKTATAQDILDVISTGTPNPWQEYWGAPTGIPALPTLGEITDAVPDIIAVNDGLIWKNGVLGSILTQQYVTIDDYKAAIAAYTI